LVLDRRSDQLYVSAALPAGLEAGWSPVSLDVVVVVMVGGGGNALFFCK